MSRPSLFVLSILVALNLEAAPQLRLSTTTLGPIYIETGSSAQPQIVNLFNVGDTVLSPSITFISASWLTATIGQPTTCSGGPVTPCIPVSVTLNAAGLPPGNYSEYVTISDPNAIDAPQNLTVNVQVNGAPSSLDFYVTPNMGAATTQSGTAFSAINVGNPIIPGFRTNDNGQWLSVALLGNQISFASYQVKVTSQPGQPEGTYTGAALFSGSVNPPDNGVINVNLHVTSQPILEIPSQPIIYNLIQGGAPQTYSIPFRNLGFGTLNISGASVTGISGLSTLTSGGASISLTATPGSLGPGSYSGTLTLASNAANTGTTIPVRVIVSPSFSGPQIGFGGIVDNAAFVRGQALAAGSISALFGAQLISGAPVFASAFPLPTTLGGEQVLMNGNALPLFYADSGQIDFQVPFFFAPGQVTVQVMRDGQPGNRVSVTIDSLAPRLFTLRQFAPAPDGQSYGLVFNSDGTLAGLTTFGGGARPARRGDIVTIYALGLGPVSPSVNAGDPAPSVEPLARTSNPVQVVYGGSGPQAVTASASYAGLAPGFAGLYQINVLLPQNAPTGNVPVSIMVSGRASNVVEIPVAPNP